MGFNRSTLGNQTAPSSAYAVSGRIMLTAVAVMLTAVFLILFLHLYLRWIALRRSPSSHHLRGRRRRLAAFVPYPSAARRGLDPAVLESIAVVVFLAADDVEDGMKAAATAECAVCLSEFEEGEKVRLLPLCAHRFHVDCIDMWFQSHDTCPLCRSHVDAPAPAPPSSPPQISRPEAAASPESSPELRDVREEAIGSSSDDSSETELRVEVPAGESCGEESGLKSPGSRRLLLRRILSGDLRLYRNGGESTPEPDLEQGEGAAYRTPPPPTLPSPSPSPPPAPGS